MPLLCPIDLEPLSIEHDFFYATESNETLSIRGLKKEAYQQLISSDSCCCPVTRMDKVRVIPKNRLINLQDYLPTIDEIESFTINKDVNNESEKAMYVAIQAIESEALSSSASLREQNINLRIPMSYRP